MNKKLHMIWFVMLGLYFSCSSAGNTPQKSDVYTVDYNEDLSVHRTSYDFNSPEETTPAPRNAGGNISPEPGVNVSKDITEELNQLTYEVADRNKDVKTIQGFTVQVYSGTSREQARLAQQQVFHVLTDIQPEIVYVQPNYKVQVGKFVERLEAQKTYSMLKQEFPSALIIPQRIKINQ
jgi:hypothetical protein